MPFFFYICSFGQKAENIFPLMSDSVSCAYGLNGDSKKNIVRRSWGRDTILFSKSVGNPRKVILDGKPINLIRFPHYQWFPTSVLAEDATYRRYKTLYFAINAKRKDTIFVRSLSNAVLFIGTSSSDTLGYEQVLFYYDAEIGTETWMVENFPLPQWYYKASLTNKSYNFQIKDSVYVFEFVERYSSEPLILWLHVSKKYGIVAIVDNRYRYLPLYYCETWYYPYR